MLLPKRGKKGVEQRTGDQPIDGHINYCAFLIVVIGSSINKEINISKNEFFFKTASLTVLSAMVIL